MANTEDRAGNKKKGFASMPAEKLHDIAVKGGQARKEKAEKGQAMDYSTMGEMGGNARKEQLGGSQGYAELGKMSHKNTNQKKENK